LLQEQSTGVTLSSSADEYKQKNKQNEGFDTAYGVLAILFVSFHCYWGCQLHLHRQIHTSDSVSPRLAQDILLPQANTIFDTFCIILKYAIPKN
jgi:hypothetical protein